MSTEVGVAPASDPLPRAVEPPPEWWEVLLDLLLRIAGGLIAFAGGVIGAAAALMLIPLRLDAGSWEPRVPASILLAVAGNALLLWFAREATNYRPLVLVPAIGWFAVMLPALGAASNGSRLMMPNDWVGLLTLFGGTLTLTIGVVVLMVTGPRPGRAGRTAGAVRAPAGGPQ